MELINIISTICPVPHYLLDTDSNNDGFLINIPEICKFKCKFKCLENRQTFKNNLFTTCHNGLNLNLFITNNGTSIYLFGFVLKGFNKLPRKKKKDFSNIVIFEDKIINWKNAINDFIIKQSKYFESTIIEYLHPLHDIKTAISLIYRNTEELIMNEPGQTIDEKIENSDSRKKSLFKSVSLLEERIKLMDLISNPKAASHGLKRKTPVYKVIDKLVKIHYAIANQKRIKIILKGQSFNTPFLYDSFSTVPLVILDNAIKYSKENQDVIIAVTDLPANGVSVSIESYSPYIQEKMKRKIFEKSSRGGYAPDISRQGSGIGLYLAQIVSEANGFDLSHRANDNKNFIDGIEYTVNIFSFDVCENV